MFTHPAVRLYYPWPVVKLMGSKAETKSFASMRASVERDVYPGGGRFLVMGPDSKGRNHQGQIESLNEVVAVRFPVQWCPSGIMYLPSTAQRQRTQSAQ